MPKLKPWFHVVTPREDLRENRPLDASEFAVNLDVIRDGKARKDYQDPERFFERTYLTEREPDNATARPRGSRGNSVCERVPQTGRFDAS